MQSNKKKLIFVAMIMASAAVGQANAGGLDAMLDGMYVNTTDAGAYHSQTRGGFASIASAAVVQGHTIDDEVVLLPVVGKHSLSPFCRT